MEILQGSWTCRRIRAHEGDGLKRVRSKRLRSVAIAAAIGFLVISAAEPGFGGSKKKAELTVESIPSGALVTVRETSEPSEGTYRVVAGETPLTKEFDFGKKSSAWLQLEKRGFEPKVVEVSSTVGSVMVKLEPIESVAGAEPQSPFPVRRISVLDPDFDVTLRKFSSEERSDSKSVAGQRALGEAIRTQLNTCFEVVSDRAGTEEISLKSVWRDARSAMVLGDPIGYAYLATAPRLETRTARSKLQQFGEALGIDAVLVVAGHQNEETGGMKAGKVGIMAAGTAASFASGYGKAMSSGDSFFTYNIYLPSFAEGVVLQAVLLHCATGEVLWINKGVWKAIPFERQDHVDQVVTDLLAGIKSIQKEEEETQ